MKRFLFVSLSRFIELGLFVVIVALGLWFIGCMVEPEHSEESPRYSSQEEETVQQQWSGPALHGNSDVIGVEPSPIHTRVDPLPPGPISTENIKYAPVIPAQVPSRDGGHNVAGNSYRTSRASGENSQTRARRIQKKQSAVRFSSEMRTRARLNMQSEFEHHRAQRGRLDPLEVAGRISSPGLTEKPPQLPLSSIRRPERESYREILVRRLSRKLSAKGMQAASTVELDRDRLRLAAALVGLGKREEAMAIYEQVAQQSEFELVRRNAFRNLEILQGRAEK